MGVSDQNGLDGLVELDSMAGDDRNRNRRVVRSVAAKIQTQLGFLAFYFKQRALDRLGTARWRLCFDHITGRACRLEYQRGAEESADVNL